MRGRIKISLFAGHHRPANNDGPTLNAGFVGLCFLGDQYCYETLYFCDFSGGGGGGGVGSLSFSMDP